MPDFDCDYREKFNKPVTKSCSQFSSQDFSTGSYDMYFTLKDETKWYGYMGVNSFMSSDPTERDIFIEHVFEFAQDGQPWTPRNTSVWIGHGEIQSLEFLPQ